MVRLASEWQKNLVSLSEVAKYYHISPFFLKHVAISLKQAGLITSKEGKGGGYSLIRHPKTITIGKIMEVLVGSRVLIPACLSDNCPVARNCPPKMVWQKINREILKSLDNITLMEICP